MSIVIAGTGHRPAKLWPDDPYNEGHMAALTAHLRRELETISDETEIRGVISGMALGFDTALALAAHGLSIPFCAAVPFEGQEARWPEGAQRRYHALLKHAKTVRYICDPGYAAWKMQRRNEWMVDKADALLALWNGSPGGTANCISYAKTTDVIIQILDPKEVPS